MHDLSVRRLAVVVSISIAIAVFVSRPRDGEEEPVVGETGGLPALAAMSFVSATHDTLRPSQAAQPIVVMLASESCTFCKEALHDLASLQGARPATGLWLMALEGAPTADSMLAAANVRGALAVGPVSSIDATMLTFQTTGTPVFAFVDSGGRTVRTIPGYPGRAWLARELGRFTGAYPARPNL